MLRTLALVLAAAAPASAQAPELTREQPIAVGSRTIGIAEIEHWARIAARAGGGPSARVRRGEYRQAAGLLIDYRWLTGEARALGIRLSAARVTREFRRQVRASFRTEREFRRYLRESALTRTDLRRRVRMDLLSNRIRDRVLRGIPEGLQQARLDEWVADYRARWTAVTRCTPRFARAEGCSGQP